MFEQDGTMLDCQSSQHNIIPYIHGELAPEETARITAHLQQCQSCYNAYHRELDAAHEITRELIGVTPTEKPRLDVMWFNIQNQMEANITTSIRYDWRHGLAALMLVVLCTLPWAFTVDSYASAADAVGATPAIMPESKTPEGTQVEKQQRIALNIEQPTENAVNPTPTSTPAIAPSPQVFVRNSSG
jgi:anti-sigma factor RsiW